MSELSISYKPFFQTLVTQIQSARYAMLKAVSRETVMLYRGIGKAVSEKTVEEWWWKSVVEQLSKDLQNQFPWVRWFSARNIWRMKLFYDAYHQNGKLPPLVAEIGRTHNYMIMEKCKSDEEREFYLRKTKELWWSKLDLKSKIEEDFYNNSRLAQNNFETTVSEELQSQVAWEFVDDYNIELVNPDQPISEKEMENAIIKNIVSFLKNMWWNFAFVGQQFRLEHNDKEYFVDLLFFNFHLNCYVVFELKAREFDPRDIGQLQMYLMLADKQLKQEIHNPSIGIIICREKDRTVVEYMLASTKQPMGVATFNNHNDLPKEIAKYLPSEEELVQWLGDEQMMAI